MIVGISGKFNSGKDTVGKILQLHLGTEIDSKYSHTDKFLMQYLDGRAHPGSHHPIEFRKFADKLKDIVCLLIDCSREDLEDQEFKNTSLGDHWKRWRLYLAPLHNPRGECSNLVSKLFLNEEEVMRYVNNLDSVDGIRLHFNTHSETLTPRDLLQLIGTEGGRNLIHPNIWVTSTLSTYDPATDLIKSRNKYASHWIITDVRFPNEVKAIEDLGGFVIRVDRPVNLRLPKLYSRMMMDDSFEYGSSMMFENKKLGLWLQENDSEEYSKYSHESETALDDYKFRYRITNDKDLDELVFRSTVIGNQIKSNLK